MLARLAAGLPEDLSDCLEHLHAWSVLVALQLAWVVLRHACKRAPHASIRDTFASGQSGTDSFAGLPSWLPSMQRSNAAHPALVAEPPFGVMCTELCHSNYQQGNPESIWV